MQSDQLGQFATRLGAVDFNRLVASMAATRDLGRLRYWQEQLLRAGGVSQITQSAFLSLFANATPIAIPQEPWSRDRFLREIKAFPYGGFPLDETPPEWMAEAWEIERVQSELTYDMSRDVSKGGELRHTEEFLHYLSSALPLHRQVELFLSIRDESPHREREFRPGFERAFPDCAPLLPPPLSDRQLMEMLGMNQEDWAQFNSPRGCQSSADDGEDIPF